MISAPTGLHPVYGIDSACVYAKKQKFFGSFFKK